MARGGSGGGASAGVSAGGLRSHRRRRGAPARQPPPCSLRAGVPVRGCSGQRDQYLRGGIGRWGRDWLPPPIFDLVWETVITSEKAGPIRAAQPRMRGTWHPGFRSCQGVEGSVILIPPIQPAAVLNYAAPSVLFRGGGQERKGVPPTRHAGAPSRPWTWSSYGGNSTARPDPTPPSPPQWQPSFHNDPPGRIRAGFGRGRVNPMRPEMFSSRTGSNLKSLRGSIFLDSGGWTTLLGPLIRNLASRAS